MGDGTRFAIAIFVFWAALVFFFFAFHPGGVQWNGENVSNPGQMLRFLIDEFSNLAGGGSSAGGGGSSGVKTAADVTASNAANYPGYTTNSTIGSAAPQGVTLT